MASRGVLFALTEAEILELRGIEDEQERVDHLIDVFEEREIGGEWAAETDKAWTAIHRCFANGEFTWSPEGYPLDHIILGGAQLYSGDDYILSLKTVAQTRDIAAAIASITEDDLRGRYRRLKPISFGVAISPDYENYTWHWFRGLADFYRRAAEAGRCVLFTVDP